MNLLFLCVGNSIRSQIAEGLARAELGSRGTVQSAGAMPSYVHPFSVEVMREIGIDISGQKSKSVHSIDPKSVDLVILVCAEEVCPVSFADVKKIHWPMPDPGRGAKNESEMLENFRRLRNDLQTRIKELVR